MRRNGISKLETSKTHEYSIALNYLQRSLRVLGNTSTQRSLLQTSPARAQPRTTRENKGTLRSERTNVTVYLVGSTEGKNTRFPTQECADLGADSDYKGPQPANLGMYSSEGNTGLGLTSSQRVQATLPRSPDASAHLFFPPTLTYELV